MTSQEFSELSAVDRQRGNSVAQGTAMAATVRTEAVSDPEKVAALQDFVLVRELGKGGIACVYLAHQLSLGRKVALKLTKSQSRGEGAILAGLEHDHIVKVYSEFYDTDHEQHGLVLQYIAGTDLGRVLQKLFANGTVPQSGSAILEVIDALSPDEVDFNPAALRDREVFQQGDHVATVCRLGARLAEALAFAHARGILHCDIKPANILLNAYGRPMLVDFNVAVPAKSQVATRAVGGTFRYMAPEQLAHFAAVRGTEERPVDQRADLYSLALVLTEAIAGKLPTLVRSGERERIPESLLRHRRRPAEQWLEGLHAKVPQGVWRVLGRCLAPEPEERYPDGLRLAAALNQAADLHEGSNRLPAHGWLGRLARHWPVSVLLILTLIPNLIGSAINIAYNSAQIPLDPNQRDLFESLILCYNALAYPVCLALGLMVLRPFLHASRHLDDWVRWPAATLDLLRRKALRLGHWVVALALIGWLPGGLIFPVGLHLAAGPIEWNIFAHFLLSFTLSGLIALIYAYLGVQFVVIRSLYPRLVHEEQSPAQMQEELHGLIRPLGLFQFLAALVPLVGAILLVTLAPAQFTLTFRLLVTALIAAGLLGMGVAIFVANYLRHLVLCMSRPGARPALSWFGPPL